MQRNIKIIKKNLDCCIIYNFESLELQNFNVTNILIENQYKPERLLDQIFCLYPLDSTTFAK